MAKVPKLIGPGQRRHGKSEQGLVLFGVDLQDAREEVFVRMVVDGIAIGIAFKRAGFTAKHLAAPSKLWALDRIQQRAAAILEARRNTGVITLPEVTGMLQRVFSSAYHADEYNAAHNAALSLARLYGHVNDRQTLEVIRRPSRDPDAPSEQDLSTWVESLPAINAPDSAGFSHSVLANDAQKAGLERALPRAPAPLLATPAELSPTPADNPATPGDSAIDWIASHVLPTRAEPRSMSNDINDLSENSRLSTLNSAARASDPIACDPITGDGGVPERSENGAPVAAVTGTPQPGGHSEPLATGGSIPTPKKKRVPRRKKRVPIKKRGKVLPKMPSAKDLFG